MLARFYYARLRETIRRKVALVDGASSGIGEAAALLFAGQGAKVVIAARRQDQGEQVALREAIFVQTDVTRRAHVEAPVSRVTECFG